MIRKVFVLLVVTCIALFYSCKNNEGQRVSENTEVRNKIQQQDDGVISLKVDKAECYHDRVNPAINTAEWNVVVSKSGRYDIWLSSATKDTTNLKYKNSVMLSILDKRFEGHPACDKIIQNSKDVNFPYFRADSFMGSMYIQDTGLFNIQIISEKILPEDESRDKSSSSDDSRLLSVFLTPISNRP